VSDYTGETVYSSDDFECCLTWINNSIWGRFYKWLNRKNP
jgi:hypothetical protein